MPDGVYDGAELQRVHVQSFRRAVHYQNRRFDPGVGPWVGRVHQDPGGDCGEYKRGGFDGCPYKSTPLRLFFEEKIKPFLKE
jgi:hypothetical protein